MIHEYEELTFMQTRHHCGNRKTNGSFITSAISSTSKWKVETRNDTSAVFLASMICSPWHKSNLKSASDENSPAIFVLWQELFLRSSALNLSLFQKHAAPIASVPESQATVIDILAHFISFDSGSPSLAFQWFVPRATLWRHGFLFKGSVHGSMISEVRTVWLLCPTPIFVQHMEASLPACLCQSAGHLPETLSPQVLGLWPWGKIKKIWPMQKWSFKCLISFFNQSYNAMHVVQQWNSSSCQEAL